MKKRGKEWGEVGDDGVLAQHSVLLPGVMKRVGKDSGTNASAEHNTIQYTNSGPCFLPFPW